MNKFKLELVGTECNGYPYLSIFHNQQSVYSDVVKGTTIIELELTLQTHNTIILKGIEKSTGQNGVWDTRLDANNNIVRDKSLLINNIWFDNIAMNQQWIQTLPMQAEHKTPFPCNSGMWENGQIEFDVELPLLNWIIYEKFIKFENEKRKVLSDRSGETRFDYEYIEDKISLIKKILND